MMRRIAQAALFLAVAVTVVVTPRGEASAQTCDGVLVVVDATVLGGGVNERCVNDAPSSGLDALTRAGFTYTFVPRIPGMVCQIDRQPDPCNNAPADAYWAYWQKPAGGTWRYATVGAGTSTPARGSSEGWVFGTGDAPPDASVAASPAPTAPPSDPPADTSAPSAPTDTPGIGDEPADPDQEGPGDARSGDALADRADAPEPAETDTAAAETEDDATDDPEEATRFDRLGIEPRQLLGLALLIIGVGTVIAARRNHTNRPGQ